MMEHAAAISGYYAGSGWYRDGHSFDYYSCWAFNVYGPIWNIWYGYKYAPLLAKEFEDRSNTLINYYPIFFSREGHTNMWGRSCIYRFASTSPYSTNMLLENHGQNYGLYRHICTGSLKQFMEQPDFIGKNGIPTLGFYRQFAPLVQGYSCADSVCWLGKAFTCLHLPADHPFWTAEYDEQTWEKEFARPSKYDKSEKVIIKSYHAPGLCTSNHLLSGDTILRTGKVLKHKNDIHGMMNYSKLCYNTSFPWEDCAFSQGYILKDLENENTLYPNVTFWYGEKDSVLYRRHYFDFNLENERHWMQGVQLADFPVNYGIIRADRLKLFKKPVELTLGAYGFPENGTEVKEYEDVLSGRPCYAVVLKGKNRAGEIIAQAFTVYEGFAKIRVNSSYETNPDSVQSLIPYATFTTLGQNHYEQQLLVSQTLTRKLPKGSVDLKDFEPFTMEEIFPIASIDYADPERFGGYGEVKITLKNGTKRTINYDGLDGRMEL